jgi:hypothetical protein
MAPPEMVDGYPVFKWPQNRREVTAMMQSNDVFIQVNNIRKWSNHSNHDLKFFV